MAAEPPSPDHRPAPEHPRTAAGWRRRVWVIAWPIILSNLSVPLVGLVDTAVMGHLPEPAYIGAVALGAVMFDMVYWAFGFLRMGTSGFVAQASGAGDADGLRTVVARAFLLAAGFGLAVVALQWPMLRLALWLLDASAEVEALAAQYFLIRVWSAPATLAGYAVLGYLVGTQQTRSALLVQLALNGINVVLSVSLVVGLGWGVAGVAVATLVAELAAAALGVAVVVRSLARAGGRLPAGWHRDLRGLERMMRANGDIFLRTLCLTATLFWFAAEGAALGELALAANAVLLHFFHVLSYGLDGFAFATEALAGRAWGARDRVTFRAVVVASTQMSLAVAAIAAAVIAVAGGAGIDLLTSIPEVRETARAYLPWLVLTPLVSVWSFQLDGVYIGATRTAEMRNGALISLAVYAAATTVAVPLIGNHGLWLAFTAWMAARALPLAAWYPRLERALARA